MEGPSPARESLMVAARSRLMPSRRELVRIDAFFAVASHRLFDKSGARKPFDASNRIKALHDALADVLGIDDRYFYPGISEPVLVREEADECVLVRMAKTPMRRLGAVLTFEVIGQTTTPASEGGS
jgi:hypothetical protein